MVVVSLSIFALVALVAVPFRSALMVPAAKLPEASRATTLPALFPVAASTAQVLVVDPL